MNYQEMRDSYIFNNQRRERLLGFASKKNNNLDKLKYVVDYFLNKLPADEIAKIDNVPKASILPFEYDYSFLQGNREQFTRKQTPREYEKGKFAISLSHADNDLRVKPHIRIYPNVYTVKRGTCIMFASELKRFAVDFGIDCEIVDEFTVCYDHYDGETSEGDAYKTDRLVEMHHYYNVFNVDGETFKIDIAGALTAMDFNKNHKEQKINVKDFYFTDKLKNNPFNNIQIKQETKENE